MKFLISLLLLAVSIFANVTNTDLRIETNTTNEFDSSKIKVFGYNLFENNFNLNNKYYNDPNYNINVGDVIAVKVWGAINQELNLTVDKKGNIFIPDLGIVNVAGKTSSQLSLLLKQLVKKTYKRNVYIYANIKTYQEVNVFVTGSVIKPGLYNGLSGDSILRFLDLAKGINSEYGSFRNIQILRNNQVLKTYDLYDFLTHGRIKNFQFKSGDVILVGNIKQKILVSGDVANPFFFEINNKTTLGEIETIAGIKPNVNKVIIERKVGMKTKFYTHNINEKNVHINNGDVVTFYETHHNENLQVNISGEHSGANTIVIKRGTSLEDVVKQLKTDDASDVDNITIFRKSVAELQKKMLDKSLDNLEKQILTKTYISENDSKAGQAESIAIMKFIKKARKVEPKGLVSISNNTQWQDIKLEDGDEIYIPHKSGVVLTQGEVFVPGAYTINDDMTVSDVIDKSGGKTDHAGDNIIIIHANGSVEKENTGMFQSSKPVKAGDSVIVFSEVKTNNMELTKSLSTILYNIAVSTKVVLGI